MTIVANKSLKGHGDTPSPSALGLMKEMKRSVNGTFLHY